MTKAKDHFEQNNRRIGALSNESQLEVNNKLTEVWLEAEPRILC